MILTYSGEAKLVADHSGVRDIPAIKANSAPGLVDAHLHTAFGTIGSAHKPQVSVLTDSWRKGTRGRL